MQFDSPEADLFFTALGNKTRRRILQRLSGKPARSISELAQEFKVSSTAISNHIALLEKAHLINRAKRGKFHTLEVDAKALSEQLLKIIPH